MNIHLKFSGVVDEDMQKKIESFHKKAIDNFKKSGGVFGILNGNGTVHTEIEEHVVVVKLNNRMRSTAGTARGLWNIDLNYRLLAENQHELESTYVHELAHIFCNVMFRRRVNHGPEWKKVMSDMGQSPDVYHKMDCKKLRRKRYRYIHTCDCEEREFRLTKQKFEKSMRHIERYTVSQYYCPTCKKTLEWTGEKRTI